jgi:hypothetical protein
MPQKVMKASGSGGHVMKRKNVPVKKKHRNAKFDNKNTRAINRSIEEKVAAKALRNESKFNFSLKELNVNGKKRLEIEEKDRERKAAKKRSAEDRQVESLEKQAKRSKNDLE